jgi:hypothetical protein
MACVDGSEGLKTRLQNLRLWRNARYDGTECSASRNRSGHLYSLDALADHLGPLPGGVVHLGSCFVLKNNEAAGRRFLKRTGASLISGYQRDVEWLDSAALDSAWLGYLADPGRIGDIERRFRKRYASLIDYLQWGAVSASR